eukprot:17638_2
MVAHAHRRHLLLGCCLLLLLGLQLDPITLAAGCSGAPRATAVPASSSPSSCRRAVRAPSCGPHQTWPSCQTSPCPSNPWCQPPGIFQDCQPPTTGIRGRGRCTTRPSCHHPSTSGSLKRRTWSKCHEPCSPRRRAPTKSPRTPFQALPTQAPWPCSGRTKEHKTLSSCPSQRPPFRNLTRGQSPRLPWRYRRYWPMPTPQSCETNRVSPQQHQQNPSDRHAQTRQIHRLLRRSRHNATFLQTQGDRHHHHFQ